MQIPAPNFSLAHTIASGQLFRYSEVADGILISHGSRVFVARQDGAILHIPYASANVTQAWLQFFFALDESIPGATDEYSAAALAHCAGMRICNQDPWECTIGFLCSQNNNVARIRQLMTSLARTFGTPVMLGPFTGYTFPEPGTIPHGKNLDGIKAGYRAAYIAQASALLSHEVLEGIHGMDYDDAKASLQLIHGIGPKVADCILLFAYGHSEAFPIDTWVEHIMRTQYKCKSKDAMRRKAQKLWGTQAGIMQQYLFHYARTQR